MHRWFKVDCDLMSKPKFIRICDAVESQPVTVAGGLVALWAWLHTYGSETDLSADRLERQLSLPKGLVSAMASVGWAEASSSGGWAFRLAGPTVPEIAEARSRAGKAGNASRWQAHRKPVAGASQKEEERREEKKEIKTEDPEGSSSPGGPEALPGSRKPQKGSRISWSESGFHGIEDLTLEAWKAAAPACEVETEIARAHAWLLGQPPQKRKRNLKAFLTGWMLRAQERAAMGSSRVPSQGVPRGCRVDSSGVIRTPSGAPLRFEEDES